MHPDALVALCDAVQFLALTAGLIAWRIERELKAIEGAHGAELIRLPTRSAPARNRERFRLPRVLPTAP